MKIEDEIFKKSEIDYDKLIPYGFKCENGKYVYSKKIMNNTFQVYITVIDKARVDGKIIDLEFGDEYTNYRLEGEVGEFVGRVREEFENILNDIKNKCAITKYFATEQANRIASLIKENYGDIPEFLWEKFPGYGVFRNSCNRKWYAAIMNINRNKIDSSEDDEVEIIDVKVDEDKISDILNKKGIYKGYHMNKDNWVSIILDDTLSDEEIMYYIEKSHEYTDMPDEWIIPANPKYYDIINCFNDTDTIIWKQSNNIKIGDIVYIYVADPYSAILYQCKVLEANIPYEYKSKNVSMKKAMRIKLLKKYDGNLFTFKKINEYGIKAIRGPRSITKKLSKKLNKEGKCL